MLIHDPDQEAQCGVIRNTGHEEEYQVDSLAQEPTELLVSPKVRT